MTFTSSKGLLAVALVTLFGLQACASWHDAGGKVERWNMEEQDSPQEAMGGASGNAYANPYCPGQEANQSALAEGLAQPVTAVFYRDPAPATRQGNPLNVYINGHYQASLVGNTFTTQQIRPGEHRLMAVLNDAQRRYVSKDAGQMFRIDQSSIQYFRISMPEGGAPNIAAVDVLEGQAAVQGRTRQDHTVARVQRSKCPTP